MLAQLFLTKNSNLNHFTQNKIHWKNPKIYRGVIFSCWFLHKRFTQLSHKKNVAVFSECVNFLDDFAIKINRKHFNHFSCYGNETYKINLPKAFLHLSQKISHKHRAVISTHCGNVKWKKFFEKTPTFLLNKVHSVYSINFLKGI